MKMSRIFKLIVVISYKFVLRYSFKFVHSKSAMIVPVHHEYGFYYKKIVVCLICLEPKDNKVEKRLYDYRKKLFNASTPLVARNDSDMCRLRAAR